MKDEAQQARDEAIERVEANADSGWLDLAVRAIRYTAKHSHYFTTDDVWDLMEHYGLKGPREPRAMAAAMARAQAEGIIRPTSDYSASARKVSHARPKRVWASQVVS